MLQRNAVAWAAQNKLLAAGIALAVIAAAGVVVLVSGGDETSPSKISGERGQAEATPAPVDDGAGDVAAGGLGGPGTVGARGAAGGGTAPSRGGAAAPGAGGKTTEVPDVISGLEPGTKAKPCNPVKVDETGVSPSTIKIGQIITDAPQLPQQLGPVHQGLEAFVKAFNASGGLCKRKLELAYRNDNLNPATHSQDFQELADQVLAFVGNDSLLDFLDYDRNPPFEPTVKGDGGFVPDVGGLAFGYGRSQSRWHAGVVGSVSPVLVGGGQFKYLTREAADAGTPCRKAGVVYLNEPTGASQDQAAVGSAAIEQSWGGGLGGGNTKMYAANLTDDETVYGVLVARMVADGMNCVFAYTDIQGSIRLVRAMKNGGYWPPTKCTRPNKNECIRVTWVPFTVYDQKFIKDGGDAASGVSTFIPHVPLAETSNEAMRAYLDALEAVPNARPSTFSIFGFASGAMLVQALQACPAAPTRDCLIKSLRAMKGFTAGGLLGGTTPFRTTRVTYSNYGTYDWKWIFNINIGLRVLTRNGKTDFYRINPKTGFLVDTLKIARGTPG